VVYAQSKAAGLTFVVGKRASCEWSIQKSDQWGIFLVHYHGEHVCRGKK
jgi:hypothetical protein